jgi:hypothetical protein
MDMNEELVLLKRIPIAQVALDLGLEQVKSASSRYVEFRGDGQKIVINTEKNMFFCNSDGIGGSVVDLVMRQRGFSLGMARAWLRKNLGDWQGVCENSTPSAAGGDLDFLPAGSAARKYLYSRGLSESTIKHAIEAGIVQEVRQNGYVNTVLVHQDAIGVVVGGEVRGQGFKSFAGAKTGLFQLPVGCGRIDLIVAVESGIDALSYSQLFPSYDALIVSSGGTPSKLQYDCLRSLLLKYPAADLIGAHDADGAGDRMAGEIEAIAAEMGRDYARHRPEGGKDWSDVIANQSTY